MSEWLILGRDGVINHAPTKKGLSLEHCTPIDGSLEAIALLTRAGFQIVIMTNQSSLSRGEHTQAEVESFHELITQQIATAGGRIDGIYCCPHGEHDGCGCRKPKTGLFDRVEADHSIALAGSYCVGDSLRDIQAAKAKGCKAVLVLTGKGTQTETALLLWPKYGENTLVFENLLAFAQHVTGQ